MQQLDYFGFYQSLAAGREGTKLSILADSANLAVAVIVAIVGIALPILFFQMILRLAAGADLAAVHPSAPCHQASSLHYSVGGPLAMRDGSKRETSTGILPEFCTRATHCITVLEMLRSISGFCCSCCSRHWWSVMEALLSRPRAAGAPTASLARLLASSAILLVLLLSAVELAAVRFSPETTLVDFSIV